MSPWTRRFLALALTLLLLGGLRPAAAQPTSSYVSPTYGFEVSWDPDVWSVDDPAALVAEGDAAMDQLRLIHDAGGTLYVLAGRFGYPDPTTCVSEESTILSSESGVSEYRPLENEAGEIMAGEVDGIAFGGFTLTFTPETGDPLEMNNFIECRTLPQSDVSLIFTVITTPDQFDRIISEAGNVNASLVLAQESPSGSPEPVETTTAETPGAITPVEVDDAWFDAQATEATAGPSLGGPFAGDLVQTTGQATLFVPEVEAENFYLRVRFQNPSDAVDAPWDFGVSFRGSGDSGEHYRLVFDSYGGWYLTLGVEEDVETGTVGALRTGADEVNSLELLVAGDTGAFRLNGELVGPLDLSGLSGGGRLSIGTAFFAANTVEGAVSRYRDLQIWPVTVEPAIAETPEPAETLEPAEVPTVETIPTVEPIPTSEPIPTEGSQLDLPTPTEAAETPAPVPTVEPTPEPTLAPAVVNPDQVVVRLAPLAGSGVEGLAVIYPEGEQTTVALRMLGATVDEVGAIHAGTCDAFDPLPSYALATFDPTGNSSSTLNLPLAELRAASLVVVLHQSAAEFGTVIACGEIPPGERAAWASGSDGALPAGGLRRTLRRAMSLMTIGRNG